MLQVIGKCKKCEKKKKIFKGGLCRDCWNEELKKGIYKRQEDDKV